MTLIRKWLKWREVLLKAAIGLMAVLGALRLSVETYRLIWEKGELGAIDLKFFIELVKEWFSGQHMDPTIYDYPPASQVFFWPFVGWLNLTQIKCLWLIASLLLIGWLIKLMLSVIESDIKEHDPQLQLSGPQLQLSRLERIFIALIPISMYATSITIGNGQVAIHAIVPLIAAMLIFNDRRSDFNDRRSDFNDRQSDWRKDLLAAMLFTFALIKPTISIPFFWLVLFGKNGIRRGGYIVTGYLATTLFALLFQRNEQLSYLLFGWLKNGSQIAASTAEEGSFNNINIWCKTLGLNEWSMPITLLLLIGLGVWVYYYRKVDLWLLMGVTALIARMWTYHRIYDDLLIIIPMISLFRIAKQESNLARSTVAGMLFAITWMGTLAPARLHLAGPPWNLIFKNGEAIIWLAVLSFLIQYTRTNGKLES